MKSFEYVAQDGTPISMYMWANVNHPKGVVQIMHGMSEHMGRYEDFAQVLNDAGYIVVGDDHRGHGKTAGEIENVGKAVGDIFYKTMKDEAFINENVVKVYPGLPYFIVGHSYGSFVAQKFIQGNSKKIDGVILSGSACEKGNIRNLLGSVMCIFARKGKPAKIFQKMSFDAYDKKFKGDGRWLTRDKEICDKYYADPYCTQVFSFGFYKSLFYNLRKLYKANDLDKIRKDLPVFIASGDKDPVGGFGKKVEKLRDMYVKLGLTDVTMKLYPDARHEILNETNRQEVYADFIAFLDRSIETKKELEEKAAKEKAERAVYFKKALEESVIIEKQYEAEKAAAANKVLTKKELRAKKKADKKG